MLAILLALLAPLQTPSAAAPNPLDRIVVLGASLSDGYGLKSELEFRATFAEFLAAALVGDRHPAARSDSKFFLNPESTGPELQQKARADEPTLVVALDFLFWFTHGSFPAEEDRLAGLETGLRLLERFDCPLVVADIPDISLALSGTGPFGTPLVFPYMLPQPATRDRINARIREWAAQRGATVVPMAAFLERIGAGQPFEVRGNRWPGGSIDRLLQADRLHPTYEGYLGLVLITVDAMAKSLPGFGERDARWELDEIRAAFETVTSEARSKALERQRRREERRQRREERREAGGAENDQQLSPSPSQRAA